MALFPESYGSQAECAVFCEKNGGKLPTILDLAANARLEWQLNYQDEKSTWIGIYIVSERLSLIWSSKVTLFRSVL